MHSHECGLLKFGVFILNHVHGVCGSKVVAKRGARAAAEQHAILRCMHSNEVGRDGEHYSTSEDGSLFKPADKISTWMSQVLNASGDTEPSLHFCRNACCSAPSHTFRWSRRMPMQVTAVIAAGNIFIQLITWKAAGSTQRSNPSDVYFQNFDHNVIGCRCCAPFATRGSKDLN